MSDDGNTPTPPDDFGESVAAEFRNRIAQSTAWQGQRGEGDTKAATESGGEPGVGGAKADEQDPTQLEWPGGVSGDVSKLFEQAVKEINEDATGIDGDGEIELPETPETPDPIATQEPQPQPEGTPGVVPDTTTSEPPTSSQEPVSGYTWEYLDNTGQTAEQHFDDLTIRRALGLLAWADNLPEDVRTDMANVTDGSYVAVPRTELDQFVAWRNQQARQQQHAQFDNLDVDDNVAQLLRQQQDEINQLREQATSAPDATQNVHQNLDWTNQQFHQASNVYQQARQLTEQELEQLWLTANQSGLIPGLTQRNTALNPITHQVDYIDVGAVVNEVLDYALTRNPTIHNAVLQRVNGTSQTQPAPLGTAPAPAATTPQASPQDAIVARKRANASSLAAAPSAAVTPSPRKVSEMTGNEIVAGIEAELRQVFANNQ